MMGTSLLAMPWAVERAGLAAGLLLIFVMATICLYTAYRNLQVFTLYGKQSGKIFPIYLLICEFQEKKKILTISLISVPSFWVVLARLWPLCFQPFRSLGPVQFIGFSCPTSSTTLSNIFTVSGSEYFNSTEAHKFIVLRLVIRNGTFQTGRKWNL